MVIPPLVGKNPGAKGKRRRADRVWYRLGQRRPEGH